MKLIELEDEYETLYEFAMQKHNLDHIEDAKLKFISNENKEDIEGFNEWFIFNYRPDPKGASLVEQYSKLKKTELAESMLNSCRSVFEIQDTDHGYMIRDIFTKDSFEAHKDQSLNTGLMSLRVVVLDHLAIIIGDVIYYDDIYKDIMIKYILDQYNQYVVAFGPSSFYDFIKENAILLFKMAKVMSEIYEENVVEEEYLVYETTYALNEDQNGFIDKLIELSDVKIMVDEDESQIFRVIANERIVAEIELAGKFVYLLCNNKEDHLFMLEVFKTLESNTFVLIKSEILTLDELL